MACDNEYCDPEIGNDCAKCFARRYIKERKAKIMLTEQEQRQMNEDIGELLAALGTTLRVLDDLSYEVNRRFYMQEAEEVHQKIGQSHRDRQSKFRNNISPWISVADRLPDITESYPDRSVPVLARTADGTRRVARYEHDYDYGKSRWIEEGRDSYWLDDVVDWMPLP